MAAYQDGGRVFGLGFEDFRVRSLGAKAFGLGLGGLKAYLDPKSM